MDWDNDGNLDLLSGCYWTRDKRYAQSLLLKGNGTLDFEKAAPIKTSTGRDYTNQIKPDEGEDFSWSNICVHPFAVDYDGDGDLDLVNGCVGEKVFLAEMKPDGLADEGIQLPVSVSGRHSAPHLVDWDGDGDLDLLSGSGNGGANWFENLGTRSDPEWASSAELIPRGERNPQDGDQPSSIQPASDSRIWVHDWNQDGKPDILLGDNVSLSRRIPGLSDEELAEKLADYEEKKDTLLNDDRQQAYHDAHNNTEPGEPPVISKEVKEAYSEWSKEFSDLRKSKDDFAPTERTGHVWLYLQKAE